MLRSGAIVLTLTCAFWSHVRAQTVSAPGADEVNMWRLCPATGLLPVLERPEQTMESGQIVLDADIVESQNKSLARLSGNVTVISEQDFVHADSAVYHMDEQKLGLQGNVQYRSEQFEFNADSMTRMTDSDYSEISNLDYFIPLNHSNGSAETVTRTGNTVTYLHNMTYTTCDPGDVVWHFKAKEMKLDHVKGMGLARHMTFRIRNIPVLYFPALSFPISDQRKSGFLYPTAGNSSRHGAEFEIPYYWNIAPQLDATLTPHYMSDRGLKINSEWRYLNSWSSNQLDYQYLDDDLFGDRRTLSSIQHAGRIGTHWSTHLNATDVSDPDYMRDFGADLNTTSISYLAQTAMLTGQWDNWKFVSRLLSYQIVDNSIPESSYPYDLEPDLSLTSLYPDIGAGFELEMENRYTVFTRSNDVSTARFDVWPRISRPFGNSGWFLIPAVSSRFTSYALDETTLAQDEESRITRTVPVGSLDSGLIFERNADENDNYLQTFEPRLFYLHVPYRDQNDIPVLDTRLPEPGVYQLYQENRFAGIDRIGDANQASVTLTNRWLSRATGEERFRVGLGQLYFFEDRLVTLPGQQADTSERSGILGEIGANFGRYWNSSLDLEWNPDSRKTDKGLLRIRYNRQNRHIFNVNYRYRKAENPGDANFEQADISFSLPISGRWSAVGRWNHSIEDDLDLDKYFGLEYESCCWAFRILAREFLLGQENTTDSPEFDKSIYFEIIFKGFSRTGTNIGQRLEENIIGYKDPFE
jgi:LPS-assembly protein